jgi:succinate-semialdehyde dehydrogenase/glutarate-semialdehyde dehydrogenase
LKSENRFATINGREREDSTVKRIRSVNPFTMEVNGEFDLESPVRACEEIERSRAAFKAWRALPPAERGKLIARLAEVLLAGKRRYAETITREVGKPIRQSITEIERSANICRYFAEVAVEITRDEVVQAGFQKSYVCFEPLGVILAIMPWNFPVIQLFRFAIPTLTAGNVVVLKPASITPLCGKAIEGIFADAGFPKGVFRTLLIDSATALDLVANDKVDGVSLTGSHGAGTQVGAAAGGRIKKAVLELGGSDPFLVLDDVAVDAVASIAVQSRFVNCGQSCVASKRFIVMKKVAQEFSERFIYHMRALKVGNPMDESTDIGPLATAEAADELSRQIADARQKGATVVDGPSTPPQGRFFRPVAVLNVTRDMAVAREETFGPIAPIFAVKDEEEMVELANSTEFGLGATIWSKDVEKAQQLARRMESGFVGINKLVKSDPRLPFGGTKKSGVGRELSHYGVREFTNVKTVIVENPQ